MGETRLVRIATVAYILVILWVTLGRPNVTLRAMHAARRTLRKVSEVSNTAAARLGDEMINRATNVTN